MRRLKSLERQKVIMFQVPSNLTPTLRQKNHHKKKQQRLNMQIQVIIVIVSTNLLFITFKAKTNKYLFIVDEDLKYYNYAFTDIKTKPKKPKTNDAAGKSVENPEKKKETRVYKSERRDPIEHFINDIYRAIDHLKKTQSVAANASKMRTILNEIPEHMILANFADYRELLRLLHKFHLLEESRR